MPDCKNVEILPCVWREGAQTDRLFGLRDALKTSAGLNQQPTQDRMGMGRKLGLRAIARFTASIAESG